MGAPGRADSPQARRTDAAANCERWLFSRDLSAEAQLMPPHCRIRERTGADTSGTAAEQGL